MKQLAVDKTRAITSQRLRRVSLRRVIQPADIITTPIRPRPRFSRPQDGLANSSNGCLTILAGHDGWRDPPKPPHLLTPTKPEIRVASTPTSSLWCMLFAIFLEKNARFIIGPTCLRGMTISHCTCPST